MRMLASAVMPATAVIMLLLEVLVSVEVLVVRVSRCTYSFKMYSFSALVSCSKSLLVTLRSAARTMPSFAKMPSAVPACEMASRAYSTW